MPNTELERYLRLATWGLWGQRKRAVRAELEGNLREMALEFELAGETQEQAMRRAILEFGPPEKVSVGMTQVYTTPSVVRTLILGGVLTSMTLSLVGQGNAQVAASTRLPIEPCVPATAETFNVGKELWPCEMSDPMISVASLRAVLEPQGVEFVSPIGSPAVGGALYATFPDGKEITVRDFLTSQDKFSFVTRDGQTVEYMRKPDDTIYLSALLERMSPVTIEGWSNATVRKGKVAFTLGTANAPLPGGFVFSRAMSTLLDRKFPSSRCDGVVSDHPDRPRPAGLESSSHAIRIQTKLAPGTPVAVMYSLDPKASPNLSQTYCDKLTFAWVAPVDAGGQLEIRSLTKNLEFVQTNKRPTPSTTLDTAEAVIVQFKGRFDLNVLPLELVPPSQVQRLN